MRQAVSVLAILGDGVRPLGGPVASPSVTLNTRFGGRIDKVKFLKSLNRRGTTVFCKNLRQIDRGPGLALFWGRYESRRTPDAPAQEVARVVADLGRVLSEGALSLG